MVLAGSSTANALVQGNTIGTAGMPNFAGVVIETGASGSTIGGTSTTDANVIAFNTTDGVTVGSTATDASTTGNAIEGNAIFSNATFGIDLGGDGATANQTTATTIAGPNDFQNYPVLTGISTAGDTTTVTGTFDEAAEPNTTLRIEFFGDLGTPTGFGQGRTFLGAAQVITDPNGHADISAAVTALPAGDILTATATVVSTSASGIRMGDTSEFSADLTPVGPAGTTTTLSSSANPATFGGTVMFVATVLPASGKGTPTGTVTFTIDGNTQTPAEPLVASGGQEIATFPDPSLSVGTHTISATYNGDSSFVSSAAAASLTQIVKLGTTTAVSTSPDPAVVGQTVTFTATVVPAGGTSMPTGNVTFAVDGVPQVPVP